MERHPMRSKFTGDKGHSVPLGLDDREPVLLVCEHTVDFKLALARGPSSIKIKFHPRNDIPAIGQLRQQSIHGGLFRFITNATDCGQGLQQLGHESSLADLDGLNVRKTMSDL
jgi:hypothetical protein